MVNSGSVRRLLAGCTLSLALVAFGCSGNADIKEQISGRWSCSGCDRTVEIQLAKAPQSLVVDGQKYDAVVENVNMDTYSVVVKVKDASGKSEVWTLQQKWDDIGKTFKLAVDHSGEKQLFVSAEHT